MNSAFFDPLLLSIATPLVVALVIALGVSERWSARLALVGFGWPAALGLGSLGDGQIARGRDDRVGL